MKIPTMHLQVALLATAQALFQTGSVLVMTVGGLAGAAIAPSPSLATLPIATLFLGTALATFPASMLMERVGRRAGFCFGALLGTAGALLAAAGIWQASLALLALGTALFGGYQGFAQFYRFAAGEVADAAFRPRAISLVLAGGVIAAFTGPWLARLGGPWLTPTYLGCFVLLAVVSALAALLLLGLRMPIAAPGPQAQEAPRRLLQIVSQPAYAVAWFGGATGFGVMVLAMTATPIAMVHHHHGLDAAATVIQLHVLGMFLPSFFTGSLIAHFGVLRIMFAGIGLLLGHVLLTLTGNGFSSFASALILLGVGWNFLYIGGTTLLTGTYRLAEKGRAQAMHDLSVFAVSLLCSLGAAPLLHTLGWQRLNLALLPWLGTAAAALLWLVPGPKA